MPSVFAPEDVASIVDALTVRHADRLGGDRFELGGRVEPGFVELSLAIFRDDRTFRYDIDVRVPLGEEHPLSNAEARDLALDFLGYYLDQYFRGGREILLPLDYQPYQLGDRTVWARGDVTNPKLDEMADEIIAAGVPLSPDDPRHRR